MALNPVSVKVRTPIKQNGQQDNSDCPNCPKKNVTFKGIGDYSTKAIAGTMDKIALGGFAAAFITQDMLGMAIPRVATGTFRNKKETGKPNWAFARVEALREFLSGPSTVFIPYLAFMGIKKFGGRANEVSVKNIKGFGQHFAEFTEKDGLDVKNAESLKKAYYQHVFEKALTQTTVAGTPQELIQQKAGEFAEKLVEIDNAPNKYIWDKSNVKKSTGKTYAKDLKNALCDEFTKFKKANSEATSVSSEISLSGLGENSFSNFIYDLQNFGNDAASTVTKKFESSGKALKEFAESFTHKRIGSRFASNALVTASVFLFFTFIPKLYKSKDGKNHGLDGLVPQQGADKNVEGK